MNTVINSLNRLQRAGAESSRVTAKLREAAVVVADEIVKIAPEDVELPRGYKVFYQHSNVGGVTWFGAPERENGDRAVLNSGCKIPGEHYLHGDFNHTYVVADREELLWFAKDIAEGLLDEIAEFIEQRNAAEAFATEKLDAAAA